jgi:hypothetical protein
MARKTGSAHVPWIRKIQSHQRLCNIAELVAPLGNRVSGQVRYCRALPSGATGGGMSKVFQDITPEMQRWIEEQRLFFVSTAPLCGNGLLNCSPKGMDSFRILGPKEVGYVDLTGSGIETAAHLAENGRIVFMFCALAGAPKIVRLHGNGTYHLPGSAGFSEVQHQFPMMPGTRGIVRAHLSRISDSCGFAVPRFDYVEDRDTLIRWAEKQGQVGLDTYRTTHNARSLDGLPGIPGDSSGA